MQTKPVIQFKSIAKKIGNKTIITFDIKKGKVKTIIKDDSIEIVIDSDQFLDIINKFSQEAIKTLGNKFLGSPKGNKTVATPVVQ